jgi:gephyrin
VQSVLSPLPVVEVALGPELAGHVLAEDVLAPADVPPTQTTSVDGYALRCTSHMRRHPPTFC